MRPHARVLIVALTLTLTSGAALAGAEMADMKGMPMAAAPVPKHGHANGVIKAIDVKAGTLTLQHGPIPGVGWPAMTMTFKAASASLLTGLKVGETVAFDCVVSGGSAVVTAAHPL